MNTLIQVDALTLGCKAEMVDAKVITEINFSIDFDGVSHVYLASSIPSIGGHSISAINPPDFISEVNKTASLVA